VTVHFIGAGPGAADLITVRGLKLIKRCPVVLYAGSLVPADVVKSAKPGARVVDTAPMTLDEIVDEMARAHRKRQDVARVHSGDPSLYGAIAEQMRRLDRLSIPYDVTPGVPAYAAAAAALKREFTLPGLCQTIVLTRTAVRASPMPRGEDLATLGHSGATLAIHLSINNLAAVVRELTPLYGADCPAIVAYRVSWPDERIVEATLGTVRSSVKGRGMTRTALILVGRALGDAAHDESRLYAADHTHVLRPKRRPPPPPRVGVGEDRGGGPKRKYSTTKPPPRPSPAAGEGGSHFIRAGSALAANPASCHEPNESRAAHDRILSSNSALRRMIASRNPSFSTPSRNSRTMSVSTV
jgi:precorrin-4/cobalt-precorrin-4 C11-methyltransferase